MGSVVYAPRIETLSNKVVSSIVNGYLFSIVSTLASRQPLPSSFVAISGFPSGGVDSGLTGGTITYTGGTTGGRPTFVGRNVYFGHPLYNIDLRVAREFRVLEKVRLLTQVEAFNVFNHTNIFNENTTPYTYTASCASMAAGANGCLVPSPTFEQPTVASSSNGLYGARQLQVSAKITF